LIFEKITSGVICVSTAYIRCSRVDFIHSHGFAVRLLGASKTHDV